MNKTGKWLLYHCLRSHGVRPYCSRNGTILSTGIVHMTKRTMSMQVSEKSAASTGKELDVSVINKWKEKLGLKGGLRFYPYTLKVAGGRLYLSAAEACRYNDLGNYVNLPDTFESWHSLTSLHIWLIMTRLELEGREGRLCRNVMMQTFIDDANKKRKIISKEINQTIKADWIEQLHEQTVGALFNYDEGMLGDDKQLAGALWRSLFHIDENIQPQDLEKMIIYVRRQIVFLEAIESKDILSNGLIPFLPVNKNIVPESTFEALRKIKGSPIIL